MPCPTCNHDPSDDDDEAFNGCLVVFGLIVAGAIITFLRWPSY